MSLNTKLVALGFVLVIAFKTISGLEWKDQICGKIGKSGLYNTKDIFPSIRIPDSIPQIRLAREDNEIIWTIGGENIYVRHEEETDCFRNSVSSGTKDQFYLANSVLGNDFNVNFDSNLMTIQEDSIKKQFLMCYYKFENFESNVICTVPTPSNAKTNLTQREDHIIVASNDVRRSIENSFILRISGDIKVQGTKHRGLVSLHTCPALKDTCGIVKESGTYNMQEIFNGPEIPFEFIQMIDLKRSEFLVTWKVDSRDIFRRKVNETGVPYEAGQESIGLERQAFPHTTYEKNLRVKFSSPYHREDHVCRFIFDKNDTANAICVIKNLGGPTHQIVQKVSDIILEEISNDGNLIGTKTYNNSFITYMLEYTGMAGSDYDVNIYLRTC
ncbi:unnamed protein product [Gordionus sp. m RMFG-2023]